MKTWKLPEAVAQEFVANEYVSACYQVYCGGPNGNEWCANLYADSNGNGTYDEGDVSIANPPYEGARFKGCGGYQRVIGEGEPHNNGFVLQNGEYYPVFYWLGEVMDPTEAGDMADFHFADLGRSDAVIYSDNPNHS